MADRYYAQRLVVFDRNAAEVSLVGVATVPTPALAETIAAALNFVNETAATPIGNAQVARQRLYDLVQKAREIVKGSHDA